MANTNPEEKYYNRLGPDLNKDSLVRDQSFLADARKFLGERKDYSLRELRDPEEVYKLFIRHMRHTEVNELAAANDLRHINDLDDSGKAQMGKLYSVWDRMDGEKSSVLDAFKDYGLGVVSAPSTYISVITGGAGKLIGATGAVAARLAAREAALGALKKTIANQKLKIATALPTNQIARSAVTGAMAAGTVEGVVGATIGGAGEAVRTRADITGEREFRISQPIIHGLFGAGLGAGIGAGVGAFTGKRQMAALGILADKNKSLAGEIAAAERRVARTVYKLDETDTGKVTIKSDKKTKADVQLYYDIHSFLGKTKKLQPIPKDVVERGMKQSAGKLDETIAEIPFPKTVWRKTQDGIYNTEIGFYRTNEGIIMPIGKETQAGITKIPIFSEIRRSGTRGKYRYAVSTGKEATDLRTNKTTFRTLQEAKNAVPSIVREQKLLPTISDDFTLMIANRTAEEAATSIQGRLSGLMFEVIQEAQKLNVVGKGKKAVPLDIDFSVEVPKNIKIDDSLLDKRFTMIMHKFLVNSGKSSDLRDKYIGDLLEKYNLTMEQMLDIFAADLSYAGRVLGLQSALKRKINLNAAQGSISRFRKAFEEFSEVTVPVRRTGVRGEEIIEQAQLKFNTEGEAFLNAMEKGQDGLLSYFKSAHPTRLLGASISEFDRFTKGFMTVQIATTARNAFNAGVRMPLYMFTNFLQGNFEYVTAAARKTGAREVRDADMKQAMSRMTTPIMFLKHMLDPQTSKAMFELFKETMPTEYSHYVRQLADVVDDPNTGGPLTKFARKMNALNTFIDNSFKRAIYTTELGNRVGHRRLIQLSRDGKFNQISLEDHLGAINEGLDFTYQTRFTGPGKTERLVTFSEEQVTDPITNKTTTKTTTKVLEPTIDANTIADTFVRGFSVPIVGSGFIPYPRFVASFLKHTFEYAPFIGMIPLEKFGVRQALSKGEPLIKLSKRLQDKLDAQNLVKIVNDAPEGTVAKKILADLDPKGLEGRKWAKTVDLANEKLTSSEMKVLKSYRQVGGDAQRSLGFILPGRSGHKRVAQQITGMAFLYGAIQLRAAQGPEAEWFEMHKLPVVGDVARGMYADARAFYGVYAPHMLVSDILLRSTNFLTGDDPKTIRSWVVASEINRKAIENSARESLAAVALRRDKINDYLEVAFGQAFKTGQGLAWMDRIAKQYQDNPDMASKATLYRLADTAAELIAQYLQRATVPWGAVKDGLGNVNPLWKDIPEDAEVNPMMIGAYGDARSIKQALLGPNVLGIMTRAFPKRNFYNPETGKTERRMFGFIPLPEGFERGAVSPETTRLFRSEGGIAKQLFGLGAGRYKNELQKEFSRLNMQDPWRLFKRYKNDILDRVAKKYTAPHVEEEVINMIRSSKYQEASPLKQRALIKSRLREIREALNDRMAVLIGATSDLSPEDEDIQAMLKSEDGERKHRQLISHFYELRFTSLGERNLRAEVRRLIKEGEIPEIVKAGFPKGTILSEVTAMAKNEDGSPKYTKEQLTLIYRLSMNAVRNLKKATETEPIED